MCKQEETKKGVYEDQCLSAFSPISDQKKTIFFPHCSVEKADGKKNQIPTSKFTINCFIFCICIIES